MERAVNPSGVVTAKPDLTEEELLSLEKFPTKIAKKYRGLNFSTDERNIITRIEGGYAKQALDKLIKMPEYQGLNSFDKEKQVDRIIRNIRTQVRQAVVPQKIVKDLKGFKNREEKISYLKNLIDRKVIKIR